MKFWRKYAERGTRFFRWLSTPDTILQMAQRSTSYYAPSAAVAALVEAIARDSKSILPVSIRLQGEYGLDNIAVSVPARIGKGGAEKIICVRMDSRELRKFMDAAEELRISLARANVMPLGPEGEQHA